MMNTKDQKKLLSVRDDGAAESSGPIEVGLFCFLVGNVLTIKFLLNILCHVNTADMEALETWPSVALGSHMKHMTCFR